MHRPVMDFCVKTVGMNVERVVFLLLVVVFVARDFYKPKP